MTDTIPAAIDTWRQPLWMAYALCSGLDADRFFPDRGGSLVDSLKVCIDCPVRIACARYALTTPEPHGIWGGLSERQRRQIRTRVGRRDGQLRDSDIPPVVLNHRGGRPPKALAE